MGGNATKVYNTKRISKEENEKIILFLNDFFNQNKNISSRKELFGFPLSYSDKESFGDIDLLTTMDLIDLINELGKNPEVVISNRRKLS